MSRSPSPTPLCENPAPETHDPPIFTQTIPEDGQITERVTRPKLSFAGHSAAPDSSKDGRRPSIQFAPSGETTLRSEKASTLPPKIQKRLSSPPPRPTYESRVSFDTFDNKIATDISFTLVSKHKNYAYSRRSRTFLCGTDQNDYSEFALEWLVEELVEDGDEIVCLRVVDKDSKINSDTNVEQKIYKKEAQGLLEHIQKKNEDGKAINLVLELAVGKVPETIQRMIKIYAPACLIVGTRGRSLGGIQGLLPGSVSKYCLQNSPVPVVVVRPEDKREKKKAKRLAHRTRQGYNSILNQGGGALDAMTGLDSGAEVSEQEKKAVAKAIGLSESAFGAWKGFSKEEDRDDLGASDLEGSPLARLESRKSEAASEAETQDSPSPTGPLVIDDMEGEAEVPELDEGLGSPVLSDAVEVDKDAEGIEMLSLAESGRPDRPDNPMGKENER